MNCNTYLSTNIVLLLFGYNDLQITIRIAVTCEKPRETAKKNIVKKSLMSKLQYLG